MVKSVVMKAPGAALELVEIEKPPLEPGAVLLETIYSEVCGTDCHLHNGRLAGVPYPIVPGHISVGRIAEMNGPVTDCFGAEFRVGDIVGFLDVYGTCGKCWQCSVAGSTTKCPHRKVYGVTVGLEEPLMGGWAEYIYLKPGLKLLRLPQNVSAEKYISGGCGLFTGFHAVERAGIKMGDTVVVQGSGPVGIYAAVFARLSGAHRVVVIGAPERRLELARRFGADIVFDVRTTSPEQRLREIHALTDGIGADVVIEGSGNPNAVPEGLKLARDCGTYVIVGQYTDNGKIEVNPHTDVNKKHLNIKGCWGLDFSIMFRTLKMLDLYHDRFPWEDTISAFYGLDAADRALADVADMSVVKAVIAPGRTGVTRR